MHPPARDPEIPRLHADYVRRLARSLVFDDALADDVAQDVWVAALEHGPRKSASLRAWLATLARNFAWKSRRGDRRRTAREESAARPEAVPSAAEILERESVRRGVIEAVLALEEPYRSTIVLRYFEDLAPRDVARRLEVPIETVRTREKRAREMLRARLDREHGSDRRAWSLALVRELRLDAPLHAGSLVSAIGGGLFMSTVKLLAGAAGVLLLVLGSLAWLEHRRMPLREAPAKSPVPTEPLQGVAVAERPTPESARVAVDSPNGMQTAPRSEGRGSLRVRVRWGDDHTPAADIGVRIAVHSEAPDFEWTDFRTDADGTCEVPDLRPATVFVSLDRPIAGQSWWGGENVSVSANQVAEIEMELALGVAVDGETVDAQGKPVPGAEIFLAGDRTGWLGRRVARSDAAGLFQIRAAPTNAYLSAHTSGRASSLRPRIEASAGSAFHARLIFADPGGDLEGIVTDPSGAPVRGAKVLVNGEDFREERFVEGKPLLGPASRVVDTDELGHYRIDGLSVGSAPVVVRASGFAQWKRSLEISDGKTTRLDARLTEQVVVVGTVHDEKGLPAPHTQVALGENDGDSYQWVASVSSEDGSFRLVGLPAGEIRLTAKSRDSGSAETTLNGSAGAVLHWDPVLSSGRVIAGRVLAPPGDLGVLLVNAEPTREGMDALVRVAADGTFRIPQLDDQPYDLAVLQRGGSVPIAKVPNVSPGRTDVTIEIDAARLPSVRIRGRLLRTSGEPVGDAEVFLVRKEGERIWGSPALRSDRDTGRFESSLLTPGNWGYSISAQGLVPRSQEPRSVAAGETWDVGDVVLAEGSVLVLTAKMENGSEPPSDSKQPPFLFVTSEHPELGQPLTPVGGVARSGPLPPGSYMLRVAGYADPPIACELIPFEIVLGQETHLDAVLHRGRKITISIRDPSSNPTATFVGITIDATSGMNLTAFGVRELHDGRYDRDLHMLDGEFRVEATAQDGRKARGTIRVVPGGADRFELDLKNP